MRFEVPQGGCVQLKMEERQKSFPQRFAAAPGRIPPPWHTRTWRSSGWEVSPGYALGKGRGQGPDAETPQGALRFLSGWASVILSGKIKFNIERKALLSRSRTVRILTSNIRLPWWA